MAQPNILILYTDQQRWDALGKNGNHDILTPNLDRLAERSLNFDHCFVQNPVCMPSRASMLSGRYPSTLGITEMAVPMPEDVPNFASYFGSAGYHCACIGKLHFLPHANRDHTRLHPSYGFDHLEISDEPGLYEDAYRAWVRREAPDQLDFLSTGIPPARKIWLDAMGWEDPVRHPNSGPESPVRVDFGRPVAFAGSDDYTHSGFVGQRTVDYIRERAGTSQPFACIAGFYSPHAPWVVPQRFLDLYEPDQLSVPDLPDDHTFSREQMQTARHGYYAMVSEVDHYVGQILDALEQSGQADRTIVVFTSDHGEWLGEHRLWGKGFPAFDACTRVPLLIHAPGCQAKRVSDLVEAVDILPTLLERAGLPVDSAIDGQSMAGALGGQGFSARTSAMTESRGWRGLRTATHRYVVESNGREQLFDLCAPQGQCKDIATDPSAQHCLSDHRRKLIRRMMTAGFSRDRVWPY